jgi:hypothetical protein
MERYLHYLANNNIDFLGVLANDEDSLPCVHRQWHLEGFDEEVVELCSRAWLRLGSTLSEILLWLGATEVPELSLSCRHSDQRVHYKLFDREILKLRMEEIRNGPAR